VPQRCLATSLSRNIRHVELCGLFFGRAQAPRATAVRGRYKSACHFVLAGIVVAPFMVRSTYRYSVSIRVYPVPAELYYHSPVTLLPRHRLDAPSAPPVEHFDFNCPKAHQRHFESGLAHGCWEVTHIRHGNQLTSFLSCNHPDSMASYIDNLPPLHLFLSSVGLC
jgi:hypothetical protein